MAVSIETIGFILGLLLGWMALHFLPQVLAVLKGAVSGADGDVGELEADAAGAVDDAGADVEGVVGEVRAEAGEIAGEL